MLNGMIETTVLCIYFVFRDDVVNAFQTIVRVYIIPTHIVCSQLNDNFIILLAASHRHRHCRNVNEVEKQLA